MFDCKVPVDAGYNTITQRESLSNMQIKFLKLLQFIPHSETERKYIISDERPFFFSLILLMYLNKRV